MQRTIRSTQHGEQQEFLEVLAEIIRAERGDAPGTEHETGGVAMPPSPVAAGTSFALGAAAATAIAAGMRDENALTNLVFAARHPELGGRSIRTGETGLAAEWLQIRDTLVRPALRGLGTPAGGSAAGQPRTTSWLSSAWAAYRCAESRMVSTHLLSNSTPVNPLTVAAFTRLAQALQATGYRASSTWSYICRPIAGTSTYSLHAYGLALDVDPACHPFRERSGLIRFSSRATQTERCRDVAADLADTAFTPAQVAAVEAIRTVDGLRVFAWGGRWHSLKDAMHFQIDVSPAELARGIAPP
jgi:hypothetical protein